MLYSYLILATTIIIILLLIVGLAIRDGVQSQSKSILVALSISLCGLFIDLLPSELPPSRPYELIGMFFGIPHLGLIWWFVLSLLDDKFRINQFAWIGMAMASFAYLHYWLYAIGIFSDRLSSPFSYISIIIKSVIILHVLWVGLSGFKDDLINTRRTARLWLAALPVIVLIFDIFTVYTFEHDLALLLTFSATAISAIVLLFWLVRFQTSTLDFNALPTVNNQCHTINPKDKITHQRLTTMMESKEAYLDPNLNIAGLSTQLGVPEHQLRALINQGMGFRNFSSYLASYRIPTAKLILAKPENSRKSILSIAFDSGFSSLSTFNRVFKSEVGISPGTYRNNTLKQIAQT